MLKDKSLHQIRAIAQSYGIGDIFSKEHHQLVQEIEIKQRDMIPKPEVTIPRPEYDARLMTKPPAKMGQQHEIEEMLRFHVERGLHLEFPTPESWHMRWSKKEDSGTMRQPLKNILQCADKVME